jgi:hypothetical protein
MKVSELIEVLKRKQHLFGDLEIVASYEGVVREMREDRIDFETYTSYTPEGRVSHPAIVIDVE